MRMLMVAVVLMTGCTNAWVNRGALIASTAALACDWGQTRGQAARGWGDRMEQNPMLGAEPTTAAVDTYFVSALALNAMIWYLAPARASAVIPAAVVAVQADAIAGNVGMGTGMCGI